MVSASAILLWLVLLLTQELRQLLPRMEMFSSYVNCFFFQAIHTIVNWPVWIRYESIPLKRQKFILIPYRTPTSRSGCFCGSRVIRINFSSRFPPRIFFLILQVIWRFCSKSSGFWIRPFRNARGSYTTHWSSANSQAIRGVYNSDWRAKWIPLLWFSAKFCWKETLLPHCKNLRFLCRKMFQCHNRKLKMLSWKICLKFSLWQSVLKAQTEWETIGFLVHNLPDSLKRQEDSIAKTCDSWPKLTPKRFPNPNLDTASSFSV